MEHKAKHYLIFGASVLVAIIVINNIGVLRRLTQQTFLPASISQ